MKKVHELMQKRPALIAPTATLQEAAQKMKTIDCGFLPVGSENSVQGIITDRDIVIRALAEGKDPRQEKVSDYMTQKVCSCSETEHLDGAADKMIKDNVSRLVIINDEGSVTGILTFGQILRANEKNKAIDEVVECAKAA